MKIFVVDDDPIDRMFICDALMKQHEGLDLLECENGHDAIERSSETQPVYALVDIRMPGLDGFQTCQAIRQTVPGRDCYIHILTTSQEEDDHKAGLQHGADAVHVKPGTQAGYAQLAATILSDWQLQTRH